MGQWEKRTEAVKWESGRFSLPFTLFNKYSGVSLRNLKGIIKNRVSGVLKRIKRGEKGLSFEKQRLYSHKLSSSVNRGPPQKRFSEYSKEFNSFLKNNGFSNNIRFSKLFFILFILLFLSSLLLLLPACKNPPSPNNNFSPPHSGGPVTVCVRDTFDGGSLSNIPITFDGTSAHFEGKTDGSGCFTFEINSPVSGTLKINFSNSEASKNHDYIPSVYEGIAFSGDNNINIDIVKKQDLNPKGYSWRDLLNAYRGGFSPGINQVWVKQPEKWVVYDPHHVLKGYSDPKHNEVFNNIMEGFKAIEEYTNGFIRAPPRDKVEIKYETKKWVDNGIFFEITDGRAYEADDANSNDELIRSGAGCMYDNPAYMIGELCASVQGGDNESAIITVFDGGHELNEVDRIWGRFNYKKREPGSRMVLDGEYGHLYEIRKIK